MINLFNYEYRDICKSLLINNNYTFGDLMYTILSKLNLYCYEIEGIHIYFNSTEYLKENILNDNNKNMYIYDEIKNLIL